MESVEAWTKSDVRDAFVFEVPPFILIYTKYIIYFLYYSRDIGQAKNIKFLGIEFHMS